MNRVLAPGVDEQAPRLYKNAGFDAQGALMPIGEFESGYSYMVNFGSAAAYIADADDTGLVAFVDDLNIDNAPDVKLLYSNDAGVPTAAPGAALVSQSANFVDGAAPGLFEGVAYGHVPLDSYATLPNVSLTALASNGQIYNSDTHGRAVITGMVASGGGKVGTGSGFLSAVEYEIMLVSCVQTVNGLLVVGGYKDVITPSADDKVMVSLAWSTISTIPYVLLCYMRKTTDTEARIVRSQSSLDDFVILEEPGAANDPLPDGSVLYVMNFHSNATTDAGRLPAVLHGRRYYAVAGKLQAIHPNGGSDVENSQRREANITSQNVKAASGRCVVYSEIGYVNHAYSGSFFEVPFTGQDEKIMGLLSTPAGLLIFGKREMFMSRGDPLDSGWQVQRVSGTLGSDDHTPALRPKRAGGTSFFVNNGRIMSMAFGMGDIDFGGGAEVLTAPTTDPSFADDDYAVEAFGVIPAIQKLVYVGTRVSDHPVMLYSFDTKSWSRSSAFAYSGIIRPHTRNDAYPFEYLEDGISGGRGRRYEWPAPLGATSYMEVLYEDISLGDRAQWKLWVGIEVFTNDDIAAIGVMVTTSDGDSISLGLSDEGQGVWRGYFPAGTVAKELSSLRMVFSGLGSCRVYPKWGLYNVPRQRRQ